MRPCYIIPVALLVSSAVTAQVPLLTDAQRAEGEAQVRKAGELLAGSLRDPASALFRNVFLRKTVGRDGKEYVALCGEVNSRNGYGGMSGFHAFMLIADRVWVGGPGQIPNADDVCTNGMGAIDGRDYTAELRTAFKAKVGL